MITFRNVSKWYTGGHRALSDVSFTVARGEMVFLTGHSGAGKSTLLKLVMLLERPTQGEVIVGGKPLSHVPARQIPFIRRHIGVVFQDHQLLFDRTVYQNVALPLAVAGLMPKEMTDRVNDALEKVGLLDKANLTPQLLSGGEQQRIGIARAVVNKPSVLLADEPTGNLDPALSASIMDLFRRFNEGGMTILVATHDQALVDRSSQRCVHLEQGRLVMAE